MLLVSAYSQCPSSVFKCVDPMGNIHIQSEVMLKEDMLSQCFLGKSYLDLLSMKEVNNKSNIFSLVTETCILSEIVYLVT